MRRTKITAPRGLFFDYKGQELVNNLPGYAVALQRQGQRDNEKVIGALSEILDMPEEQIRKRIAANQNSYHQPDYHNNRLYKAANRPFCRAKLKICILLLPA